MIIRNGWATDKDYFAGDYPNNVLLADAKARFELQKTSLEGKSALVDGVSEKIVAQNHTNPLNQAKYDKKISFDITSSAHTGSILVFDGITWIVTSKMFDKMAYKVGSVLECNNTLKWIDDSGAIKSCPAFLQNKSLYTTGVESNKWINVPDSKVNGYIPVNADTILLNRDKRFLVGHNGKLYAYKITLIDLVTLPGLMLIIMEEDMIRTDTDNLELGIADYIAPTPTPSPAEEGLEIVISGDSTVRATLTESYTSTVYEDGDVVSKNVVWSIANTDATGTPYATITTQSGTGCTITAGNYVGKYVTLTASLTDDEVTTTAQVQIKIVGLF